MAVVAAISHVFDVLSMYLKQANTWTLLISFSTLFGLYHLVHVIYLVLLHPLRAVPGPFWAKFSKKWQDYHAARLQKARAIQAAHKRYGPIIRVGPNEVSFADPGLLNAVYGHGVPVVKTPFYEGGHFSSEQNVFSMRNRDEHAGRRKLMSRNFAQAPLMDFAPHIVDKTQGMLEKLNELSHDPVDVYRWLHRLGLEIILMQTLGHNPRMIENDTDHPVLKNLELFQVTFAWMAVFPMLRNHGVRVPIKSISEPFVALESWVQYTLQVVAEDRAKSPKERSPFINRLMENQDDYLGRNLTDLEIAEEIVALLFAGSGTTANTLAFLFYAVAENRDVYHNLKTELNRELKGWPESSSTPPDISHLQKLPYTNAVILEALRRYPTIPGTMPRSVTSSTISVGDFQIPQNTVVGAQNFSLHLNETYFPDPEKFLPERFLDAKGKAREGLNAFSAGPRGCLGRNLAMLEMQIVVPLFFRYFDVEVDRSMTAADVQMKEGFSGCPAGEKVVLTLRRSSGP